MGVGDRHPLHWERRDPRTHRDGRVLDEDVGKGQPGYAAGVGVGDDASPDVGREIARQDGHPGALTRGVGHDLIAHEDEPELGDAEDDEQQQREDEGELDELRALFRAPSP